jgi:hypothetical protein
MSTAATGMANPRPVLPFANDGSFMQQFMSQQQQQNTGVGLPLNNAAHSRPLPSEAPQSQYHAAYQMLPLGWTPATEPQDMLMQGASACLQFDVHNSSPQLIFAENNSVVRRTVGMDPTASKFCFAALVPITERHGRFAVRLDRGTPSVDDETTFSTHEGMFLGVGIARRDCFGEQGFGRGLGTWGLSNRRCDDYPAVFTTGGGATEKRMPILQVGDIVSLHWDLDVGAVLMRINGSQKDQHVFKIPGNAPDHYVAGVSLANDHQVRRRHARPWASEHADCTIVHANVFVRIARPHAHVRAHSALTRACTYRSGSWSRQRGTLR